MTQAVLKRVCLREGRHLVDEALIGESVLQQPRGSQWAGEEWRCDGMGQYTLASDGSRSSAWRRHAAGAIRGVRVGVVAEARWRAPSTWDQRRSGETNECAGNDNAPGHLGRTVALWRRETFVIPNNDLALLIEASAQVDNVRLPIVLSRRHLVLAGQLHPHRFAHHLREQRRVIANSVCAIEAVAPRSFPEDDANVLLRNSQYLGHTVSLRIDALRSRPDCGGTIWGNTLPVRDPGGAAARARHLIRNRGGGVVDCGCPAQPRLPPAAHPSA